MSAKPAAKKPLSSEKKKTPTIRKLSELLPGILATLGLALLSIWLSDLIGGRLMGFERSPVSPIMIAILLGLLLGTAAQAQPKFAPGLKFSVKKILRLGIILLGIRLTIFDVFKLGTFGIPVVAVCIVGALIFTTWINQKLKLPERLGTLIAVGTSICGVTAIVAASPAIDAKEEESAYAISVITVFGLVATLAYPFLANEIFAGDINQIGMFIGTSIHETAQVVGAGQIYADIFSQSKALDIATITKLVRNVFMAGVIPVMAVHYARKAGDDNYDGEKQNFLKLFPVFIFGFLLMAVVRSLGDAGSNTSGQAFGILGQATWSSTITIIKEIAEFCLVIALAGVGLSTNFNSIKNLGIKPFLVGLCAAAAVGILSIISIKLIGNYLQF